MNNDRRKTLTGLNLVALVGALEDYAGRAESVVQEWRSFSALAKLRTLVEEADNEVGVAENAEGVVQDVGDEEQASFDNLPEGLQQAERGQRMEEVAGHLSEAGSSLNEACDYIRSAVDAVGNLDTLLAETLVDEETGLWLFSEDGAEEVEALFEQVKDDLRGAVDSAQAAVDMVEDAVGG